MRDARVWFEKHNRYISHLDLNRFIIRAVRRAGLPIWVTEGFNPHPYINFALPLSLGFESVEDCFDIRVVGEHTNDEIYAMLEQVMPATLPVTRITDPEHAFKEIAFARFSILGEGEEIAARLESFFNREKILVEKKGKKSRKGNMPGVMIDLKEQIKEVRLEPAGKNAACISVILPAGSSKNIGPQLLLEAIRRQTEGEVVWKAVTRTGFFLDDLRPFC